MTEFEQGVLYVAELIVQLRDEPVIAACIIREAGLADADISELDDFDKRNLAKLNGERGINFRDAERKAARMVKLKTNWKSCNKHGEDRPNVWGYPECLRELREENGRLRHALELCCAHSPSLAKPRGG
jgi:hypothetical protein